MSKTYCSICGKEINIFEWHFSCSEKVICKQCMQGRNSESFEERRFKKNDY